MLTDKIKDSWSYEKLVELGYKVRIYNKSVKILFEDNSVYASFSISKEDDGSYTVRDTSNSDLEIINYYFDYDDTYEECVISCLCYFLSRY